MNEAQLLIRCLSLQERLSALEAAGSDAELRDGGSEAKQAQAGCPSRRTLAALSHAFERLGLLSEADAVALSTGALDAGLQPEALRAIVPGDDRDRRGCRDTLLGEVDRAGLELERALDWLERRASARAVPGLVRRLREEGNALGRVTRVALAISETALGEGRRARGAGRGALRVARRHTRQAPKTVVAQLLIQRARREPGQRTLLLGAAERLLEEEPWSDAAWRRVRASLLETRRGRSPEPECAAETHGLGAVAPPHVGPGTGPAPLGREALGRVVYEALGLGGAAPRDAASHRVPRAGLRWRHATTGRPEDASRFVLDDPRRIVFDLATGRQRIRAWTPSAYEGDGTPARTVWWCDVSPSMGGPRASLRDTLVEEARRSERPPAITHEPPSLDDDPERAGGMGFSRGEQGLVVVTDGEDDRVADWLRRHGERLDTLCVVLLGEDSAALRSAVGQLASRVRARFHHLDDLEIARWRIDPDDVPLLADPGRTSGVPRSAVLEALESLVSRGRPPGATVAFDVLFPESRGRRGRGSRAGLGAPPRAEVTAGAEGTAGAMTWSDGDRVASMLEAVCEALALAPGAIRAEEAVELLERLLDRYELPMRRYQAALRASPAASGIVETVRLLCAASGPIRTGRALPTSLKAEVRP